jgi:methanogenic corrinoid protein MtbC1
MSEEIIQELAQVVIDGDIENAEVLAKKVVEQGLDANACIMEGLINGLQRVGSLFASGEYRLPELIISADAMEAALKVLEPALIGDQKREVIAVVVLRTMEEGQNENGKIFLGTMLTDKDLTNAQKLPVLQWLS